MDRELLGSGIHPGHPSLYESPDAGPGDQGLRTSPRSEAGRMEVLEQEIRLSASYLRDALAAATFIVSGAPAAEVGNVKIEDDRLRGVVSTSPRGRRRTGWTVCRSAQTASTSSPVTAALSSSCA